MALKEPKQQETERTTKTTSSSYNDYVSIDVGSEPVGLAFNLQTTADDLDSLKQERFNKPR